MVGSNWFFGYFVLCVCETVVWFSESWKVKAPLKRRGFDIGGDI